MELLTNPGDVVFCESYTWPGFIAQCLPRDRSLAAVAVDSDGLVPGDLERQLCKIEKEHGSKQRMLYTIAPLPESFLNKGSFKH